MASAIIKGKALRLWLTGTPTAIGSAKSCALSINASMIKIRHKDQTGNFVEELADEISGSLTADAYFDETDGTFGDAATDILAGTEVAWEFHDNTTGHIKFSGTGNITKLDMNGGVGDLVGYSIAINTTGTITKGTVPV